MIPCVRQFNNNYVLVQLKSLPASALAANRGLSPNTPLVTLAATNIEDRLRLEVIIHT